MASPTAQFDLIVLGGGTAGMVAVREALDLGMRRVAIVNRRNELGGECAFNACVPLHTLQQAANSLHALGHYALRFGIQAGPGVLEAGILQRRIQQVIHEGPPNPYAGDEGVVTLTGNATFIAPHVVGIDSLAITGRHILVATGAKPVIPKIPGLEEAGYRLYHQLTHFEAQPPRMAVIGGGRIGLEMAQAYQRLGTRVTLLERQARLLPREEPEAGELAAAILRADGVDVRTGVEILDVATEAGGGKIVRWVECGAGSETVFSARVAEILVAAGRRGAPGDLNLEAAGVAYDEGGILINRQCRTSTAHIWAAGDVAGPYRYTHVADYQAVVAVHNMVGSTEELDYRPVPFACFIDPAFVRVGLGEEEARRLYPRLVVLRCGLDEITRYRLEGRLTGFAKILVDGETDQIVGAHILADHAEDPVHILSLAMMARIPVLQLAKMVYAYPTKAQVIQRCLEQYRRLKARLEHHSELAVEKSAP